MSGRAQELLGVCGTCKWHRPEDLSWMNPWDGLTFGEKVWVCHNYDSLYCDDETDYNDTCIHWEERE